MLFLLFVEAKRLRLGRSYLRGRRILRSGRRILRIKRINAERIIASFPNPPDGLLAFPSSIRRILLKGRKRTSVRRGGW